VLKVALLQMNAHGADQEANRRKGEAFCRRAFENMCGLAMSNYASPDQNGRSIAVHPMCFDAEGRSQDHVIVEADEREGVFVAPFDLEAMRAYRARETWGNAYRTPDRYRALAEQSIEHPFIRKDARR